MKNSGSKFLATFSELVDHKHWSVLMPGTNLVRLEKPISKTRFQNEEKLTTVKKFINSHDLVLR